MTKKLFMLDFNSIWLSGSEEKLNSERGFEHESFHSYQKVYFCPLLFSVPA